jgi:hypothetical protein
MEESKKPLETQFLDFFKKFKRSFVGVIRNNSPFKHKTVEIPFSMVPGIYDRVVYDSELQCFTEIIISVCKGETTGIEGLNGAYSKTTEFKHIPIPDELKGLDYNLKP